ncbi:MAG: diacylglycerol/lipid kinase family protein [Phycisphaerales bacterium]
MRCVILFNPIAGRGKARRAADALHERLRAEGFQVDCVTSQSGTSNAELDRALTGAVDNSRSLQTVLIVVGGDGSVRGAAPFAMKSGAALYQFPLGTENLFAREFKMTRSADALVAAINQNRITRIDVGDVNGQLFLLMVSIGFDAEVVHDLALHRSGSISHASYVGPIIRQLRRWKPHPLTITIDDQLLELPGPGMVVIANCRQYGFRFDPAPDAVMHDGQLDLAFIPMKGVGGLMKAAAQLRLSMLGRERLRRGDNRSIIRARGSRIVIEANQPQRCQVDGDPGLTDAGESSQPFTTPLNITIQPLSLSVLQAG